MLRYMNASAKPILVSLDLETAQALDRVAPGRSRQRSRFIRDAIRQAIDRLLELETAAAYARQPDSASDAVFLPEVWEAAGWDDISAHDPPK